MPYITQERRREIFKKSILKTPGELNFVFSGTIQDYLTTQGTSYQTINDIIGALEGAKLEFYRRVVAPYEDMKIKKNGDVYVK